MGHEYVPILMSGGTSCINFIMVIVIIMRKVLSSLRLELHLTYLTFVQITYHFPLPSWTTRAILGKTYLIIIIMKWEHVHRHSSRDVVAFEQLHGHRQQHPHRTFSHRAISKAQKAKKNFRRRTEWVRGDGGALLTEFWLLSVVVAAVVNWAELKDHISS